MTMIPPKIKGLPKLRPRSNGFIKQPQQGSYHSNKGLYMGGSKMVK